MRDLGTLKANTGHEAVLVEDVRVKPVAHVGAQVKSASGVSHLSRENLHGAPTAVSPNATAREWRVMARNLGGLD